MAFGKARRRTERSKIDATPPWAAREAPEREETTGPYDILDAPGAGGDEDGPDDQAAAGGPDARIDFGSLQVPVDIGLDVRVEVNAEGTPASVTLAGPAGTMQLGVFAAPRTEGIWDEVRGEIRLSIAQQGGMAEDGVGPFGPELIGRLPQKSGLVPVRFFGVDGPRWFLRAMLIGPAAADRGAAGPFEQAFRRLVVVRGESPLPVREAVPIVLPKDLAAQIERGAAGASGAEEPGGSGAAAPRRRR